LEVKSAEEFGLDLTAVEKLHSRCLACRNKHTTEWKRKNVGHNILARRKYRKNNRAKENSHAAVRRAIKSGALKRLPCSVCGDVKSEAHHEDYSKPLDVIWLCLKHHRAHHLKKRRENEEQ
jgi:hypothetical protein